MILIHGEHNHLSTLVGNQYYSSFTTFERKFILKSNYSRLVLNQQPKFMKHISSFWIETGHPIREALSHSRHITLSNFRDFQKFSVLASRFSKVLKMICKIASCWVIARSWWSEVGRGRQRSPTSMLRRYVTMLEQWHRCASGILVGSSDCVAKFRQVVKCQNFAASKCIVFVSEKVMF